MRFRFILFLLLIVSCAPGLKTLNQKKSYNSTGFAYLYNDFDFKEKIIKGKMNNSKMQISHQNLKIGTLLKIINPKNKKSIVLKNTKRIRYPEFYKILITQPVLDELNLNKELPVLEIIEIKKNKSFIAEKAKVFNEEKKIPSNAPVTSVKISNISKNKVTKSNNSKDLIFIHIASFYSKDTAEFFISYNNIMKFWNGKFPEKIINIKYENLVDNFELEVKNLFKNLNLKWEDQVLKFYDNARSVETASFLQVRKNIYKNSSEEWKKYQNYLSPMIEVLTKNNIKF